MPLPKTLAINAWTGEPGLVQGGLRSQFPKWALSREAVPGQTLKPSAPDWACWRDPKVGWGLVLPERPGFTKDQLATAADAPKAIQRLVAERGNAPVFRYRAKSKERLRVLRDYRSGKAVDITAGEWGLQPGRLPRYLLLYGPPSDIPWDLQYALNSSFFVGRLDLTGDPLNHYVDALISDFSANHADVHKTVVWAVDHGKKDITHLMRNAVASQIHNALQGDPDLSAGSTFIDGSNCHATVASLVAALTQQKPGLVVTSSHGQTGPLENRAAMLSGLGLPVDEAFQVLKPNALLEHWQPDGAIWYAHACCSAGSDANSSFVDLIEPDSRAGRVLVAVSDLGSHVAPLPTALLGAKQPLRAFIGHVEPTFDWTLIQKQTGQHLTAGIRTALYDGLFEPWPVGLALESIFQRLGPLWSQHDLAVKNMNSDGALSAKLTARDVRSTVLLGDPTAILPPL